MQETSIAHKSYLAKQTRRKYLIRFLRLFLILFFIILW